MFPFDADCAEAVPPAARARRVAHAAVLAAHRAGRMTARTKPPESSMPKHQKRKHTYTSEPLPVRTPSTSKPHCSYTASAPKHDPFDAAARLLPSCTAMPNAHPLRTPRPRLPARPATRGTAQLPDTPPDARMRIRRALHGKPPCFQGLLPPDHFPRYLLPFFLCVFCCCRPVATASLYHCFARCRFFIFMDKGKERMEQTLLYMFECEWHRRVVCSIELSRAGSCMREWVAHAPPPV